METTNPLGANLMDVADSLIMENPSNPEPKANETVEASEDTQTEAVEDADVVEDVDDTSDIDEEVVETEEADVEDVEEEEPTVDPEPYYTVKVDGEEREVTLEELKRGYSGQKYIQKGMTEVAETRKQFEQEQQETARERQLLKTLITQMQQGGMPVVPEYPSEELFKSDPFMHQRKAEEYRRAVDLRQQWEQNVKYIAQREQEEQDRAYAENLEQQHLRLAEWMPEFKDETKRKDLIADMTKKAKQYYDLTDEQISTVQTAEEVRILNDALKWRHLQSTKPEAKKKAEGARPVVKPAAKRAAGSAKANKRTKATTAMKQSGSIDDAANWLLS